MLASQPVKVWDWNLEKVILRHYLSYRKLNSPRNRDRNKNTMRKRKERRKEKRHKEKKMQKKQWEAAACVSVYK